MDEKHSIICAFLIITACVIFPGHSADLDTLLDDDSSTVDLNKRTYFINPSDKSTQYHIFSKGAGTKTINGNGARIMFTSPVTGGMHFSGFTKIVLKDMTINWLEKPFSTVLINSVNANRKTIKVSYFDVSRLIREDPEFVSWGTLFHENGDRVVESHYDVVRFRIADGFESKESVTLSIDDASMHFFQVFEVGQILTIVHRFPDRHAVLFSSVENIILDNVEINSSPAMGIVVSDARSVDINRVKIIPSSDSYASTNSDGVHILDSGTQIKLNNSEFFGIQDDGLVISTRGTWSDDVHTRKQPKDAKCRVISESKDTYTFSSNLGTNGLSGPEAYFCSNRQRRSKIVSSSSFRDIRGIGIRIASGDVSIRGNKFERITDQSIFIGGIFYPMYAPQTPAANVDIYENEFITINLSQRNKDLYGVIESSCKPFSWCKKRNLNSKITIFDNIFTGNGARAQKYIFK